MLFSLKNLIAPHLGLYLTLVSLLGFSKKKNLRQGSHSHSLSLGHDPREQKLGGRGLGVKQGNKQLAHRGVIDLVTFTGNRGSALLENF